MASVSNFERVGTGGERVLIFVTDSRRDAVKLQADAGSAGPSVRGGSIALDLAASASLTGAHNFETLVAIVFVDEHIVSLVLPRRQRLRRKGKVLHLCGLR